MPLLESDYVPPRGFRNPHVQTIYPSLFRRVDVAYERERIETPDGDFLDLDRVTAGHARVAVVSHGLEGSADRAYVRGMARALARAGWDVVAWNYRGCSGEPNRLARSYHSGATEDLDVVVRHALGSGYRHLGLVGFSLGGNLTLKYVGERGNDVPTELCGAVAISTPADLAAGVEALSRWRNAVYMTRFMRQLREKVRLKKPRFPDAFDDRGLRWMRTFHAFDERFTAPLHGFESARDYWTRCSCGRFLGGIRRPALMVNALDDPFLHAACYPVDAARAHRHLWLEMPAHGGHVGFVSDGDVYWSEARAVGFLDAVCG